MILALTHFFSSCREVENHESNAQLRNGAVKVFSTYKVDMDAEERSLASCSFARPNFEWGEVGMRSLAYWCAAVTSIRDEKFHLTMYLSLNALEEMDAATRNCSGDDERIAMKMLLSQAYWRLGFLEKAKNQLKNLLEHERLNLAQLANTHLLLGETYYREGRPTAALIEFEKVAGFDRSQILESCRKDYLDEESRKSCFSAWGKSLARRATILAELGRDDDARSAFSDARRRSHIPEIDYLISMEQRLRGMMDEQVCKDIDKYREKIKGSRRSKVWLVE